MLRVTRWSPDTCGCVYEYEWDDSVPQEQRTHTLKKAIKLCEHHKTRIKPYDDVVSENTGKNIVFGEAQKIKPELTVDDYTWSFDKDRKLTAGFLGKLTAADKANLKMQLDGKVGKDKVEVI